METILLTKTNCPKCDSLKNSLNGNPKGRQALEKVKMVHETEQADEYVKLTTEHNILSMPALIHNGELVPNARIMQVLMTLK